MRSYSMTAAIPRHPQVSTLLFWVFIAAVACPVRVDFAVGPFNTISILDVALLVCGTYFALRFVALVPISSGPPLLTLAVFTPAFLAVLSVLWTVDAALTTIAAIKYFYSALIYLVAVQFGT